MVILYLLDMWFTEEMYHFYFQETEYGESVVLWLTLSHPEG